jgi:hypothetical protein
MHRLAKTKVLHAWFALVAFLFGVLAPAISHAVGPTRAHAQVAEICTSSGIELIAPASADEGKLQHGLKHCDFCTTHPESFALLPKSGPGLTVIRGHDLFPALFYQSPSPLFAWTLAKSRAPPPRPA